MKSLFIAFTLIMSVNCFSQDCTFTFPTTLSLNGQDHIDCSSYCTLEDFQFKIYNRWGSLLFTANATQDLCQIDLSDKKFKKIISAPGTYYWICSYTSEDAPVEKTGVITFL